MVDHIREQRRKAFSPFLSLTFPLFIIIYSFPFFHIFPFYISLYETFTVDDRHHAKIKRKENMKRKKMPSSVQVGRWVDNAVSVVCGRRTERHPAASYIRSKTLSIISLSPSLILPLQEPPTERTKMMRKEQESAPFFFVSLLRFSFFPNVIK